MDFLKSFRKKSDSKQNEESVDIESLEVGDPNSSLSSSTKARSGKKKSSQKKSSSEYQFLKNHESQSQTYVSGKERKKRKSSRSVGYDSSTNSKERTVAPKITQSNDFNDIPVPAASKRSISIKSHSMLTNVLSKVTCPHSPPSGEPWRKIIQMKCRSFIIDKKKFIISSSFFLAAFLLILVMFLVQFNSETKSFFRDNKIMRSFHLNKHLDIDLNKSTLAEFSVFNASTTSSTSKLDSVSASTSKQIAAVSMSVSASPSAASVELKSNPHSSPESGHHSGRASDSEASSLHDRVILEKSIKSPGREEDTLSSVASSSIEEKRERLPATAIHDMKINTDVVDLGKSPSSEKQSHNVVSKPTNLDKFIKAELHAFKKEESEANEMSSKSEVSNSNAPAVELYYIANQAEEKHRLVCKFRKVARKYDGDIVLLSSLKKHHDSIKECFKAFVNISFGLPDDVDTREKFQMEGDEYKLRRKHRENNLLVFNNPRANEKITMLEDLLGMIFSNEVTQSLVSEDIVYQRICINNRGDMIRCAYSQADGLNMNKYVKPLSLLSSRFTKLVDATDDESYQANIMRFMESSVFSYKVKNPKYLYTKSKDTSAVLHEALLFDECTTTNMQSHDIRKGMFIHESTLFSEGKLMSNAPECKPVLTLNNVKGPKQIKKLYETKMAFLRLDQKVTAQIVSFEGMKFSRQIRVMQNSDVLLTPIDDEVLSVLLFMPPESSVILVHWFGYSPSDVFQQYSLARGIKFNLLECEPDVAQMSKCLESANADDSKMQVEQEKFLNIFKKAAKEYKSEVNGIRRLHVEINWLSKGKPYRSCSESQPLKFDVTRVASFAFDSVKSKCGR